MKLIRAILEILICIMAANFLYKLIEFFPFVETRSYDHIYYAILTCIFVGAFICYLYYRYWKRRNVISYTMIAIAFVCFLFLEEVITQNLNQNNDLITNISDL